jgi:ribosome-associated heat shock protein Hsp15
MSQSPVRIDKWLWAVRLCKTRQLATDACRLLRVRMGGHEVKASRVIRPGDVIEVKQLDLTRTVRVKATLETRVGAKLVSEYMEDLTQPAEFEAARRRREERSLNFASMPDEKPGKRDRRLMDQFLDDVQRAHDTVNTTDPESDSEDEDDSAR